MKPPESFLFLMLERGSKKPGKDTCTKEYSSPNFIVLTRCVSTPSELFSVLISFMKTVLHERPSRSSSLTVNGYIKRRVYIDLLLSVQRMKPAVWTSVLTFDPPSCSEVRPNLGFDLLSPPHPAGIPAHRLPQPSLQRNPLSHPAALQRSLCIQQ